MSKRKDVRRLKKKVRELEEEIKFIGGTLHDHVTWQLSTDLAVFDCLYTIAEHTSPRGHTHEDERGATDDTSNHTDSDANPADSDASGLSLASDTGANWIRTTVE